MRILSSSGGSCPAQLGPYKLRSVGRIKQLDRGTEHALSARHLIGRASACQLWVDDPRVSALHAELIWSGRAWSLQDLGSRNGTTVHDQRLEVGQSLPLERGDEFVLAGTARFCLLDDAGPHLIATAPDGEIREAEGELLSLPCDDDPELTIYRAADGSWVVESADGTRRADERVPLIAGKRPWRLTLPTSLPQTTELTDGLHIYEIGLRFRVSRDQEHVEIDIIVSLSNTSITLEDRVHLALLLVLARARVRDAQLHDPRPLPTSEQGWVYRDDLPKMLGVQPRLINLWFHRARKQFARAGIRNAAEIIERRANGTQVRLGVRRLEIINA